MGELSSQYAGHSGYNQHSTSGSGVFKIWAGTTSLSVIGSLLGRTISAATCSTIILRKMSLKIFCKFSTLDEQSKGIKIAQHSRLLPDSRHIQDICCSHQVEVNGRIVQEEQLKSSHKWYGVNQGFHDNSKHSMELAIQAKNYIKYSLN